MTSYQSSILKQFQYYKSLGDKTFEQLSFEELKKTPNEDTNNIIVIVKHIVGNMLSRWTDFLTEDGEKAWRNRDREFEDTYASKEEMVFEWHKGWTCLFNAIDALNTNDLESIIYIRNQGHTVVEGINRQLAHYAYHIGQIVFIGKMTKQNKWKSLSIPKGASSNYNTDKFKKDKGRRHFTDDL